MREILSLEPEEPTASSATEAEPFEAFFRAENDRLFRLLFVVAGNRQEAEDLAQEAFVKMLERWDRVRAMEDPRGYLYRTAINAFHSRYRRSKVALRRALRLAPPSDPMEPVEARHVVREALMSLSPRQRAALVLTEGFGYSAREAGHLLSVRESTVRNLHRQARMALLERAPVEEDDA